MAKAFCAALLLLIITLVNNLIIGQNTTGDCSKDDQDLQKYYSDAFVALAKTIQSEFQNLKAQIQTANNDIKAQVVRLETRVERHDRNMSYSLSENRRQMQTENVAVMNAIQGQCRNTSSAQCPNGFNYTTPDFQKCYAFLRQPTDWNNAQEKCRQLHKDAQLVVINGTLEKTYIVGITLKLACPGTQNSYPNYNGTHGIKAYWIGARRRNISDCSSTFEWASNNGATFPMHYSNWTPGEPNCAKGSEACAAIDQYHVASMWNDLVCTWSACPLCEVKLIA